MVTRRRHPGLTVRVPLWPAFAALGALAAEIAGLIAWSAMSCPA